MVKLLLKIFVTIVIFSGALYTGILGMIGATILVIVNDFLPFIPLEIRLGLFMVILALTWALANSFTD